MNSDSVQSLSFSQKMILKFLFPTFLIFSSFLFGNAKPLTELLELTNQLERGEIDVNDALRKYSGEWLDLAMPLFGAAVKQFNITFANKSEKNLRYKIFVENLKEAERLTKLHKKAFFGINKFSFYSFDEFQQVETLEVFVP